MDKKQNTLAEYYNLISNSTYIQNLNSGVIVGQMYNKQQDMKPSDPSMVYADGTKSQSNYLNPKNIT